MGFENKSDDIPALRFLEEVCLCILCICDVAQRAWVPHLVAP